VEDQLELLTQEGVLLTLTIKQHKVQEVQEAAILLLITGLQKVPVQEIHTTEAQEVPEIVQVQTKHTILPETVEVHILQDPVETTEILLLKAITQEVLLRKVITQEVQETEVQATTPGAVVLHPDLILLLIIVVPGLLQVILEAADHRLVLQEAGRVEAAAGPVVEAADLVEEGNML
jgi:hypothetical protein